MENVIIIGSGPAGYTAALYCARANLNPLLFEGMQPGGQLTTTTEVENFPAFPDGITGPELVERMRKQCEKFGTRLKANEVVSVDFSGMPLKVKADDGLFYEAKSVIVATGASARYLGLPSEQALVGRGVSGCATCDGALYRGKRVAVVGGGDTAMEDALFLTRFASKVFVIHRRNQFRASKIMADRVLNNSKIEVVWDSVVDDVLDPAKQEVIGVRLLNVKTGEKTLLEIQGLFIAIGHTPNTAPFVGVLEMDQNGYIKANNTRTNIPGVFAAGDVQDPHYRQAVTAAGSGCMAALEVERFLQSLNQ